MTSFIALLAQAPAPTVDASTLTENHNVFYLIWHANPVVQLTILLLIFFSVVSWAIIIAKHRQTKKSEGQAIGFINAFLESRRLEEMALKKGQKEGPAYRLFSAA